MERKGDRGPMTATKQTRVEDGTTLMGTMRSRCQVVINGTFEGEITAPSLKVSPGGTLLGTVKAQQLSAAGTLGGKVEADEIMLAGHVLDKTHIKAAQLTTDMTEESDGSATTFGACTLEVGGDPQQPGA